MVQITPLRSGDLNQRVTLQLNSATSTDVDKNGAQLEIWVDDFACWAALTVEASRPGGAEYFTEPQRRVEDKALFRVRYWARTAAIDPGTHRLVHNGKTWNIQRTYDPDGSQRELHIETNVIT